jgi:hypothetical protein
LLLETARTAMPLLLAAVKAVLELADNWSTPTPNADGVIAILDTATQECADMIREAIARELGKGAGDDR